MQCVVRRNHLLRVVFFTNNDTGTDNTSVGRQALLSDTIGSGNTANGHQALLNNIDGNSNTAVGRYSGDSITGSGNVCIGQSVAGEPDFNNRTYIRNVNTDSVNGDGLSDNGPSPTARSPRANHFT
jgi:trimeric autotransporter adhesin